MSVKPSLLLVGLGNPGASYVRTRHNAGFRAVEALGEKFGEGEWKPKDKFTSICAEGRIVTAPVLLVKPQTYMNVSGEAVHKLIDFYKLSSNHVIVLCDDIDLPLGTLRLRASGSAGTHNGLKSVIEHIGEEFPRLRIGIGPKPTGADLAAWVVSAFSESEEGEMQKMLDRIPGVVRDFIVDGKTVNT